MLGYRTALNDRASVGVVGFGTYAKGSEEGASYSALRVGTEVAVDARLTPRSKWVELHVVAGLAATGIVADGTYCLDGDRMYGVDCPDPPDPIVNSTDTSAEGLYPSGHAAASLAFGQNLAGLFHGARVSLHAAGGTMPVVVGGVQESASWYGSLGLSLSLGLGARKDAESPSAARHLEDDDGRRLAAGREDRDRPEGHRLQGAHLQPLRVGLEP
jgi:hypothetical protein